MTKPPASPPEFILPPELHSNYTNLARISHTPAELVFDFAEMLPGETAARVVARLVMSPVSAKLFHHALTENLARFESAFGEIRLPGDTSLATDLFRSIHPPDAP